MSKHLDVANNRVEQFISAEITQIRIMIKALFRFMMNVAVTAFYLYDPTVVFCDG